jgi:PAS domain S-box-containing protein
MPVAGRADICIRNDKKTFTKPRREPASRTLLAPWPVGHLVPCRRPISMIGLPTMHSRTPLISQVLSQICVAHDFGNCSIEGRVYQHKRVIDTPGPVLGTQMVPMQDQLGQKRCGVEGKEQGVHVNKLCPPSAHAKAWRPQTDDDGGQIHQRQGYSEAVLDALPGPVAVMDLDGRIRHANQRFLHSVGRTREQVLEKTPSELGLSGSEQFRSEVVPKLTREGSLVSVRTVVQRPDGCSFPALLSFGLLRGPTGEPKAIIVTSQDISPLEQAHKAKSEKEKALRTLLHAIPESLFLLDSQGRVLACNETAAKRIGRSVQELVGRILVDCLASTASSDLGRQFVAKVAAALDSGEPAHFTDERDGLALEYAFFPIHDGESQAVDSIVVLARDIMEQIKVGRRLREYRERLRSAEQLALMETFSATLIHEATQPLSVIQLANQTALAELRKLHCPAAVRQDLEASLTACAMISSTIERFRDCARKSASTRETQVRIASIAEWTIRLLQHSARQTKITIHTKDLETLPPIWIRENELEQLFFALVHNAVQAADGSRNRGLLISGLLHKDRIELRFEDNCGGIEPALLPRLFKPFVTTKPAGRGMGLGLCIVRRIVQRKGGEISIQNRYGEGATFVVTLPIE